MSDDSNPQPYHPAEHTVDEVNAYLDEHPDEVAEVLRVEGEASEPRKGIVHGRHGTPASEPASEGRESVGTTTAVIVNRPGSVNQAEADADAKRRNDELEAAGVNGSGGYVGSDAGDLQRG